MIPFIRIVTTILKLSPIKILNSLLIKTINKTTGKKIITPATLIKYLENPKNILTDISKIPKKQLEASMKELQKEYSQTYKEIKDKQKQQTKQESTIINNLSSSWIKKGKFKKISKKFDTGELTIWIQSDKSNKSYGPYTYPLFERSVWSLMKLAKGKNGTGAGSVFWKYYLHSYYPSAFRKYVKKNFGTKSLSTLTRNYSENSDKREKYRTNSNYDRERLIKLKNERKKAFQTRIKEYTFNKQTEEFKNKVNKNKAIIASQKVIKKSNKVIKKAKRILN